MKSNNIDIVVITGAGRGIGRGIALDFGKRGVNVLCISKTKNSTLVSRAINKNGGSAESLALDLSDYEKTYTTLSKWVKKRSYKRYALILAAAVLGPRGPITKSSLEKWDDCHRVNVLGNLAVIKSILPVMIKNKFGRIITFAGGGSAYPFPTFPAYSATKTAIVRIAENLYEDLKQRGDFIVVCLAPGAVATDMLEEVREAGAEVRSTVDITKPIKFVREVVNARKCAFSGAFVHVNNDWKEYLNSNKKLKSDSYWRLRRIE